MCFVFFFKQKTAYEMRISDWSSDVCSSDLAADPRPRVGRQAAVDRRDREAALDRQVGDPGVGQAADAEAAAAGQPDRLVRRRLDPIGRAACRERVWQYV